MNDSPEKEVDIVSDLKTSENTSSEEFPEAVMQSRNGSWIEIVKASKMWWVTLLCVLAALGLAWSSLPESGTEIAIHFPEGHGLKPEDEVRHRGISVGVVESVELNPELSGIDVTVSLKPGADALARDGSRFWIVRPEFSLKGISGLDTAVGSKYIAVDPGDPSAQRKTEFDGLAVEPPDAAIDGEGIEFVLRGDEKRSINPGSPVTWRGVEVGRVLSVDLSPDARYVDIQVRIRSPYAKLLRTNSKFWATSGVDLDFSLQGVKLNAESLETIARGGVSFITLEDASASQPVASGHVFKFHPEASEEWLKSANSVRLMESPLPRTNLVQAQWRAKGLAFVRRHDRTSQALIVQSSLAENSLRLILPGDMIVAPENAEGDSFTVSLLPANGNSNEGHQLNAAKYYLAENGLVAVPPLTFLNVDDKVTGIESVDVTMFRVPRNLEDCWVVKSAESDQGTVSVHQSIGKHELVHRDGIWQVDSLRGKPAQWHGAPVVSLEDSKIIGILIVTDSQPAISPITDGILKSISN